MENVLTLQRLLEILKQTEMVYIHDQDERLLAIVIPARGWWQGQLPEAPTNHFGHEHVEVTLTSGEPTPYPSG